MVKRPIWQYGIFQIPASLVGVCLLAAGIVAVLELGCPSFWSRLFLGLAWIALMWMLVLPLDLFLRVRLKLGMDTAGRLSIFHAVLWSLLTLAVLILSILPLSLKSCAGLLSRPTLPTKNPTVPPQPTPIPSVDQELVSLDWARWRANIWDQMFLGETLPGAIGSEAKFSFVVYRDGHIEDIKVEANDPELEGFVRSRIESLEGTEALVFIESTRRDQVRYESSVIACRPGSLGCDEPADPNQYPDQESFTRPRF